MPSIRAGDLDLERTLFSGQCFDWARGEKEGIFEGFLLGDKATLSFDSDSSKLNYSGTTASKVRRFLDLSFDYPAMASALSADNALAPAIRNFYGTRILSQDPWECAVAFTVSQNNNMPRIRNTLSALRNRFGKFPTPTDLLGLSKDNLKEMGLGYRAAYLHSLASAVSEGSLEFSGLARQDYLQARASLESVHGIGPKVADCILLYSLGKREAFPADTWIRKAVARHYATELRGFSKSTKSRSREPSYDCVGEFARRRFGPHAGYAQQFLFLSQRSEFSKTRSW